MVIQRWQSVLLFLATVFMVLLCVLPLGCGVSCEMNPESVTFVKAVDVLPLLIVGVVTAVLLFISIFLYKNLDLQKRTIVASCILIVGSMIIAAITGLWLSFVYTVPALLASVWAYVRVGADQKLLRSYDRLR